MNCEELSDVVQFTQFQSGWIRRTAPTFSGRIAGRVYSKKMIRKIGRYPCFGCRGRDLVLLNWVAADELDGTRWRLPFRSFQAPCRHSPLFAAPQKVLFYWSVARGLVNKSAQDSPRRTAALRLDRLGRRAKWCLSTSPFFPHREGEMGSGRMRRAHHVARLDPAVSQKREAQRLEIHHGGVTRLLDWGQVGISIGNAFCKFWIWGLCEDACLINCARIEDLDPQLSGSSDPLFRCAYTPLRSWIRLTEWCNLHGPLDIFHSPKRAPDRKRLSEKATIRTLGLEIISKEKGGNKAFLGAKKRLKHVPESAWS
jgi:hypothetical protein